MGWQWRETLPVSFEYAPIVVQQNKQEFEFEQVRVNARGEITQRSRGSATQQTEWINAVALEMVTIPGGTYLMGTPEGQSETPQHRVTITPFEMSKYPITQKQWQAVMGSNPSYFKGENRPVESITWHEAVEFCARLSENTGKIYRLPNEAQWEYACRAGTKTPFYFGETIMLTIANYDGNYTYGSTPKGVCREETSEVGHFPANAFGLYDMHGNIWEWCADPWHENYQGAPSDGQVWETGGDTSHRVVRGGSWDNLPRFCRSAYRLRNSSDCRFNLVGFRVVAGKKHTIC